MTESVADWINRIDREAQKLAFESEVKSLCSEGLDEHLRKEITRLEHELDAARSAASHAHKQLDLLRAPLTEAQVLAGVGAARGTWQSPSSTWADAVIAIVDAVRAAANQL